MAENGNVSAVRIEQIRRRFRQSAVGDTVRPAATMAATGELLPPVFPGPKFRLTTPPFAPQSPRRRKKAAGDRGAQARALRPLGAARRIGRVATSRVVSGGLRPRPTIWAPLIALGGNFGAPDRRRRPGRGAAKGAKSRVT